MDYLDENWNVYVVFVIVGCPRDSKYISIYYSILPNFHVVGGYRPEDYNYKLYSIGRDLFVIIIITITDR